MYKEEERRIERFPFGMILLIYILFILSAFIQGGKGFDSIAGIERCSALYWVYISIFTVLMIGINVRSGFYCEKHTRYRREIGYDFDEQDIQWSSRKVVFISVGGFVTGVLSGMLGLGGGSIMGPILLMLNVRPEVTAATAPLMVFFTSSISLTLYSAAGNLDEEYAVVLMAIALVGAVIGIFVIQKIVKRYQRASILVFVLSGILILATLAVAFYGIRKLIEDEKDGDGEYGFIPLC